MLFKKCCRAFFIDYFGGAQMQHFSPEQVKQTLFSTIDSLAANRLTVSGTVFQLDKPKLESHLVHGKIFFYLKKLNL